MPFRVTQWPYSPDPRPPSFSVFGWNFGQVASWQWVMSSTGATGHFAFLNDGVVLSPFFDSPGFTDWRSTDVPLPVTEVRAGKIGVEEPVSDPPWTVAWSFLIQLPSLPQNVVGNQEYLFPNAIQAFGPWAARDLSGPVLEIPNGITITPAIWNL